MLPFENLIRQVVHTCIEKANQYGFQSIAFPLLGTAESRFSTQITWGITLRQIIRDLSAETHNIVEVIVVLYGKKLSEDLNVQRFIENIKKFGWKSVLYTY